MSDPEQARRAKRDLIERLAAVSGVVGIGLAREGEGYVVVVRLAHHVPDVPSAVSVVDTDGQVSQVAVRSEIVGTIGLE